MLRSNGQQQRSGKGPQQTGIGSSQTYYPRNNPKPDPSRRSGFTPDTFDPEAGRGILSLREVPLGGTTKPFDCAQGVSLLNGWIATARFAPLAMTVVFRTG
jgi:hypothetical protein